MKRTSMFGLLLGMATVAAGQNLMIVKGDLGPLQVRLSEVFASERATPATRELAMAPIAKSRHNTVVQVFSSPEKSAAERLAAQLRAAGYAASVEPLAIEGINLHRVRIGPLPNAEDAREVASVIRSRFQLDAWITR